MSKGEDDEEDLFRMVIKVTKEGHPELYSELASVGRVHRAERMRMLATMSLWHSQSGDERPAAPKPSADNPDKPRRVTAPQATPAVDPEEEARRLEQERLEAKRRSFKDSLVVGFNEE